MKRSLFTMFVCGLFAVGCGGNDKPAAACLTGTMQCGDLCVNPATDQQNCGACGHACDPGFVCNGAGTCELSCQTGLVDCGGTCIDPKSDRMHCGAAADCQGANAGNACASGQVCSGSGTCAVSCQAGLVECNGTCIDPKSNRSFCGASADCTGANSGTMCQAGEVCNGAGVCELSCQAGLIDCSGTCVDPNTDRAFCGASADCTGANAGAMCQAGEVCNGAGVCQVSCQAGLVNCNGTCIDPNTDRAYCGASADCTGASAGTACQPGEICNGAGVCEVSCQAGLVACGGTCIDPTSDENYCGASDPCATNPGTQCGAGYSCEMGSCKLSCAAPSVDCGGSYCVDTDNDRNHCGDCATVCAGNQVCQAGTCVALIYASCKATLQAGASQGDGLYMIDPNGGDPADAFQVYCDMTTNGGGWTQCLSFVNSAAEDYDCSMPKGQTWFDQCVAWTTASWTGSEVMVQVRNAANAVVYTGYGTRPSAWTTTNLTSTNVASSQYDRGSQHANFVPLNTGHRLTISGWDTANQGWGGSWGNGYGIVVANAAAYASNVVVSAMSFRNSGTYNPCGARSFLGFTAGHELMFDAAGGITTYNNATLSSTSALTGELKFFVR